MTSFEPRKAFLLGTEHTLHLDFSPTMAVQPLTAGHPWEAETPCWLAFREVGSLFKSPLGG